MPNLLDQYVTFTIKPATLQRRLGFQKLAAALKEALEERLKQEIGDDLTADVINTFYQMFGYVASIQFADDLSAYEELQVMQVFWKLGTTVPVDWYVVYEYYAMNVTQQVEELWYSAINADVAKHRKMKADLLAPIALQPDSEQTEAQKNDPLFVKQDA